MVHFCINMLMPRMRTLDITVKLCSPKGAMGYCLELDNKRQFEIEASNKLSLRKLLETIAHEMVHHKQNERGDLRGNPEEGEDGSPWEDEANAKAGVLVRRFGKINPKIYDI